MKKMLVFMFGLVAVTTQAEDLDKRQVLAITESQRVHILEEMRTLLAGTQKILFSLSEEDMAAVAQHARSLGMHMAHKTEDHLKGTLPKEFMQLGMSVHRDFDQIALDAESLKDSKHTLRQLSESMNKCMACHATYQIQTIQQPVKRNQESSHHMHC
ncbi:hypothetical protein [Nitrosomonas sp.]|uniref:hypothetical protein n=1 Tax=Nitrosomonas sp. TaxID=42353 RepID=UPI00208A0E01|nr:hypothetical protein [Nitrosomonas sp.]GJL75766.1 MAG: hypothetical protein NMNS02_18720 [Nitrosomonas sp.]